MTTMGAPGTYGYYYPQTGGAQIIGADELDKTLRLLSGRIGSRVMRSALAAGALPFKQHIRAAINAHPVRNVKSRYKGSETSLRAGVRKTVGHSVKKDVTHGYLLKVGFGVGKKGARRKARTSHGRSPGKGAVGISARNVHWFVTGTTDMRAFFAGVLRDACLDAQANAAQRIRKKAAERLQIETERARQRKGGLGL